jgi:hypothetical protein
MASTYGNDLRLEEIGDGEQSGTWGATTNTNLELIAEALSFGTEAITTNADTHTTTIADGATDPGRSLYLKYTGTLDSTCTITIAPNSISKTWYIENGTSGSQSIIISQGSGANVTIPTGQTKVVYSDGAGSGAAMAEIGTLGVTNLAVTTNATVGGTLGVTGVLTGTSLDISGNVDIDGTLETDALSINSTAVTSTAAELNILDGVTATTAELNIMDGVTATTAELNIMDGVTSTTAELNILDGVTSTAAELNQLDAITRGSILYGNASGATARLAKGGANTVLTSDGTDISWAAAGGGGEQTFTASGSISAGALVGLNIDGTISTMGATAGTSVRVNPTVHTSTHDSTDAIVYDTVNNKTIQFFRDQQNSGYLSVRVGTVSGTSISYGTTVAITQYTRRMRAAYDPVAERAVCVFRNDNDSSDGYAVAVSVSGTTPTAGSIAEFNNDNTEAMDIVFDSNANKLVIVYKNQASAVQAKVVSISGTSLSFGTAAGPSGATANNSTVKCAFDSNSNKVIAHWADSSTYYPMAAVGTVSGTSISWGSEVEIEAESGTTTAGHNVGFDASANKTMHIYGVGNVLRCKIGTVSGTSISFGAKTILTSVGDSNNNGIVFDSNKNILVIFFAAASTNYGSILRGQISGTSFFSIPTVNLNETPTTPGDIVFDPDTNQCITQYANDAGYDIETSIFNSGNPSWVGVAAESISNGATGKVTVIGGINTNQSGLVTGAIYGLPSTATAITGGAVNAIGTALSSSSIYINTGKL